MPPGGVDATVASHDPVLGAPDRSAPTEPASLGLLLCPDLYEANPAGHRILAMAEAAPPLRFGIAPPNAGAFGDPRAAAELAMLAEDAGWDGYFSWDGLPVRPQPPAAHDPWVILSAVAVATERMRIGSCIAVVPRYKPHLLARTLASLDVLSNGRLILGVGIGDGPSSFEAFGESGDPRVRAEKLDEALEIITALWSGEELTHRGNHYAVDGVALTARPIQQPRIPIWVGGDSVGALRRAARWDGWIGPDQDPLNATAEDAAAVRRQLESEGADDGIELAWGGRTSSNRDSVAAYRRAGATWWIEVAVGSRDDVMARVAAGPPTSVDHK